MDVKYLFSRGEMVGLMSRNRLLDTADFCGTRLGWGSTMHDDAKARLCIMYPALLDHIDSAICNLVVLKRAFIS